MSLKSSILRQAFSGDFSTSTSLPRRFTSAQQLPRNRHVELRCCTMDQVAEAPLRTNHRSQASEFYGFVAWTTSTLAFVLYILWALLPEECIEWFGIYWYPNREWAILLPAWSIMLVITIYVVYSSLAIASTPSFSDMSTITDNYAVFPSASGDHSTDGTSVLYDIPIGLVNRVMYDGSEFEQDG